MEMKNLKYLVILVVVIITFYVKNKMDSSNKAKTQALESLDDGTTVIPSSVKK
jgi:preprotein translocase subunit YajC